MVNGRCAVLSYQFQVPRVRHAEPFFAATKEICKIPFNILQATTETPINDIGLCSSNAAVSEVNLRPYTHVHFAFKPIQQDPG